MLGLDVPASLSLTAVATVFTAVGAVGATLLSDYIAPWFHEQRKRKQELATLYQKYSDPLRLSASDLVFRVFSIIEESPRSFLLAEVLESRPDKMTLNSKRDPYFQRYKLMSTIYRFCAFLGWLELYRQEITYLRSVNNKDTKRLEEAFERIRSDFADGTPDGSSSSSGWNTWMERIRSSLSDEELNASPDWTTWKDAPIYREEMRAIGESMTESREGTRNIIGYARFTELLESDDPSPTKRWAFVVSNFLIDLAATPTDYRYVRLQQLAIDLVDLIKVLDKSPVDKRLLHRRHKLEMSLSSSHAVAHQQSPHDEFDQAASVQERSSPAR